MRWGGICRSCQSLRTIFKVDALFSNKNDRMTRAISEYLYRRSSRNISFRFGICALRIINLFDIHNRLPENDSNMNGGNLGSLFLIICNLRPSFDVKLLFLFPTCTDFCKMGIEHFEVATGEPFSIFEESITWFSLRNRIRTFVKDHAICNRKFQTR